MRNGFIENFAGPPKANTIVSQDSFDSATGNGKIGLLSSYDIASAAFDGLTATVSPNTDRILFGPELITYDEVKFLTVAGVCAGYLMIEI
jgi:hypothetical protein